MDPQDLGEGVRVARAGDGELEVRSERLRLPWTPRRGALVGSGVRWREDLFEVTELAAGGRGQSWRLRPWPEGEAVRGVFPLDRAWVEALAADVRRRRRATARFWWTLPLAPILALAPGRVQRRWQAEWGFPARRATLLSALAELALGAFLLVLGLAAAFGGGAVGSGSSPRVLLALPLCIEGLARLFSVLVRDQPMGSVLGAPLLLVGRSGPPPPGPAPTVQTSDGEADVLEVMSPVRRRDWGEGGSLVYRGDPYRLASSDRLGGSWVYTFRRAEAVEPPLLRLAPPPLPIADPRPAAPRQSPRLLVTTLVTALVCLAPADLQTRWSTRLGTRAVVFTLLGA